MVGQVEARRGERESGEWGGTLVQRFLKPELWKGKAVWFLSTKEEMIWMVPVGQARVLTVTLHMHPRQYLSTLIICMECDQHPCFYPSDNPGQNCPRLFVLQFTAAKASIGPRQGI
jgi:hypothetical protein